MYKRLKKICILSVCLFMVTGCSINKKNNEGMSNKDQSLSSSKSGSVEKEWDARGIKFAKNDKASLVSVVFHSQIEKGDDKLFIGHVGIMLKSEDGIYFVEKVAFQEPYRFNKFKDKGQLKRYLMEKYDVEFDQPTSKPFVMENDSLI